MAVKSCQNQAGPWFIAPVYLSWAQIEPYV